MQSDLHKIIVSPQPLSSDHVKVFLYQILRGKIFPLPRKRQCGGINESFCSSFELYSGLPSLVLQRSFCLKQSCFTVFVFDVKQEAWVLEVLGVVLGSLSMLVTSLPTRGS